MELAIAIGHLTGSEHDWTTCPTCRQILPHRALESDTYEVLDRYLPAWAKF